MAETRGTLFLAAAFTLALVVMTLGGAGREAFQAGLAGLNPGANAKGLMKRLVLSTVVAAYHGAAQKLPAAGVKPMCKTLADRARAKYRGDLAAWFGMAADRPRLVATADLLADEIEAFIFQNHCENKSRAGAVTNVAGLKAALAQLAAHPATKVK